MRLIDHVILGLVTLALYKTTSLISSSIILQLLKDRIDKDKVGKSKSSSNKMRILSTSSTLNKKLIGLGYLISGIKKIFNFLQ